MSVFFDIKVRLSYAIKAHYRRGHWVHSPFTFRLLNFVLFEKYPFYSFSYIESVREKLLHNPKEIKLEALGPSAERTTSIAKETKRSTKPARQAQLLQRLCFSNHAKYIVELGTNMGLSTMYLAANDSKSRVWTFEGQKILVELARKNIKKSGLENVTIIEGDIDKTLKQSIDNIPQIDLLFVDANHRLEPTLRYYELAKNKAVKNSIFIFDDIHYSPEMEEAWNIIRKDKDIRLSIDIFSMGMVWFNTDLPKQHYIVAF